MTRGEHLFLLSMAALAGFASAAHAGGFAIREQGAYGQGSSFAGMAAGGSLSTMFWNPATLSAIEGMEMEKGTSLVLPFIDVDYSSLIVPSTEDDIGLNAIVPSGYFAKRINDRLVVGVGMNGSFGLATAFEDDSPIKNAGVAGTSKVFSLNINPAVSYQLTDWLSVAAGLQLQYLDLRYTSVALPVFGVSSLTADDIGFGFTAGIELTPFAGTSIGVGYRSFIDHELEGTLTSGAGVDSDATAQNFDLPDIVSLGLRQTISERVRVMAGAEWSNWSRFDTVDLESAGTTIPLGFNYEDGWFFSAGGEFDVSPKLTLRGGIGYELSPIDEETRTFRLPDNDRIWLSAGGSYARNARWTFDAGYSLIIPADDTDILTAAAGGPAGNQGFSGSAESNIHIISIGAKRKFGPVAGAPAH